MGTRFAEALGWEFADGDEFHPNANVGKPRRDSHRRGSPALAAGDLGRHPRTFLRRPLTIVVCSALKAARREVLLDDNPRVRIVYLIQRRMEVRTDHFSIRTC